MKPETTWQGEDKLALSWLPAGFEILSAANSAQDLCRRIVHHPLVGKTITGACLYALNSAGDFVKLGCYGLIPIQDLDSYSQFDDNLLGKAVKAQQIQFEEPEQCEELVIAIPGNKGGLPNGILVVTTKAKLTDIEKTNELETLQIVTNALGLFIGSTGFDKISSLNIEKEPRSLTKRQLTILAGMVAGKTNIQIANELILSESAIKQEAVKIFRNLGVSTRQEAATKAKVMGLLDEDANAN